MSTSMNRGTLKMYVEPVCMALSKIESGAMVIAGYWGLNADSVIPQHV